MLNSARILVCLLVLLAGCTTASRRATKPRPPDWELTPAPGPAPPPAPPVAAPSAPPAEADWTWIPLARWAAARGLATPRCLAVSPVTTYAVTASGGVLVVQIGIRSAFWDGLECRLGFAPQLIGGQVFLHALDLRKNLEPLLRGPVGLAPTGRVIVLDPGHGGASTGARSAFNGAWEKEYTLDWALRLQRLLEPRGWEVWLTRTNDTDVALADRVALAEARHASLFLSLHFNSSGGGPEQAGLETYCLTPAGMPSNLTRGYGDDADQVFPNNAFDEPNLQLAVRLHRALLRASGGVDRGVRRARFLAVLRGQNRPAVLLEGGYLSNPKEARRIADPAFRQRLAQAIAEALE